jgi:tRNA (guanine-N7-)-methyltransferase
VPHLVVKEFEYERIKTLDFVKWYAIDGKTQKFALLNVGSFLLEIKQRDSDYVIRADKLTKPANAEAIKKALLRLADALNLEVIAQNTAPKSEKEDSPFLKPIAFFENYTPNAPINVEVGFGSGRHLLHQAKKHPHEQFIGLEIHTTSIAQVLKQIELQNIDNVTVVNYDARLFLELLPSNSCKNIYVHFPVPWDKKPHRRVISQNFVDESMRVLQKEAVLNLRTDSENYFHYSFETFFAQNVCECKICKNQEIEISSKYEDRWKKQNKNIYDFYLRCLNESKPKNNDYDFSFDTKLTHEVDYDSKTYEGYFVHFENVFIIDDERVLVKVSFGSFDKPENRYIFIDKGRGEYLFHKPVKTNANYKAHQKITEMLTWQT